MKIGEVYFIRERDRLDGANSQNVKIGIVKDVARDSQERLKDHQTGNPRDLELHHVTQTPGPHRVETFLHQKFGPNRVRSEWFRLSDEELETAVQTAERMALEAFTQFQFFTRAEELKKVVSSPEKIAASEESTRWIIEWSKATAALKICKQMSDNYKDLTRQLTPDDREQVELEELVVTEWYTKKKFDKGKFAEKYPGLLEKYNVVDLTVGGNCVKKSHDVDLAEVDRDLTVFSLSFQDSCDQVKRGEAVFGDLFDLHQILERFIGSYTWDEEVADAHLRVICGPSAGIDGQVTWNRTTRERTTLDEEWLESDHPEKYREFVTTETLSRLKTNRRARRAAPPAS